MAFDVTRQEILKQANDLLRLFRQTRVQKYKDEELRLRRIVAELEAFTGGGGGSQNLQQVTDIGATTTNAINVGGITTDYVQLDTAATPTLAPGMFAWNDAEGTADLRLKGGNVTLQIGQETVVRVVNKTGADLLESQYKVVRVRIASEGGAQGQRLAVVLAQGDNDPDSATTLGIVTENINVNQEGFITVFGNVNNINTTGSLQGETWVDGDVLYLSPTTAGGLTKVKPQAPQHTIIVGYVVYAHANNGKIFVKVDNGYELDELHNVLITSPANNDLLQYNSSQQVWKNVAVGTAVPTPTLDQVTTAGNRTQNDIYVGTIGSETELSRMTQVDLANTAPNFTISNYDTLVNGAVIYRNLSGGAAVTPLVNGTTYYVKKLYGLTNPAGNTYKNNQVELYSDSGLTSVIYLTANIVGNHYLEQANRTITNTLFANKNFQIDDGFLLINAKEYKTGDVHWISPKSRFLDTFTSDGEGGFIETETQTLRQTTLLVGPYYEFSTSPLVNSNGVCVIHSNDSSSFIGISWNGINYGIGAVLPSLNANTTQIGGYFTGMGVASYSPSSDTNPSFGILASNQSGSGRGSVNFTAYNNKRIETFNNVLDNGSGRVGINVSPSEMLHVFLNDSAASTTIRVDSKAQQSQTLGGQLAFYRDIGGSVINGATLLGKITTFGLSATPSTFIESASIEVRSISGAWTTTTNRSAQFLFFTRHQNTYAERMRLTSEGNLLINTTTNGTFRLDVNGTARIQNVLTLGSLASDPAGTNGMIYYNTTTNKFRAYENGAWVNII